MKHERNLKREEIIERVKELIEEGIEECNEEISYGKKYGDVTRVLIAEDKRNGFLRFLNDIKQEDK